ncbi:MAG: hypothetical protein ABIF87_07385 [Pseudomonadota bacterium]
MAQAAKFDKLIVNGIRELSNQEKEEVLNFIEFLKVKEDQVFIEYVNMRTQEAVAAKKKSKVFSSLDELQKEYA